MAVVQTVELATYIVGFAIAAKAAQTILSDGEDPMSISEYTFDIEIKSSFEFNSQTDIKLNIWRLTLTETITVNLQDSWSINIGCKIVPTVTIV